MPSPARARSARCRQTSSCEPGSTSRDEMIAAVSRGLLVTDFWYTRVLDPRTQVVTG